MGKTVIADGGIRKEKVSYPLKRNWREKMTSRFGERANSTIPELTV